MKKKFFLTSSFYCKSGLRKMFSNHWHTCYFFSLGVSIYWNFHGVHEISWLPWNFMGYCKIHGCHETSWNPRNFHGSHENSMESMKISWDPRNFHGSHENFVESMKISWNPRNFHGIHENFMDPTPRNPWNPWKINWIVPLSQVQKQNMCRKLSICIPKVLQMK